MRTLKAVSFAALGVTLLIGNALAHGEDKPGPHNGVIRMPGAFHTEVAQDGDDKFRVYLLDLQFKDLNIAGAKISAKIKQAKRAGKLTCEPAATYFRCQSDDTGSLLKGKLVLEINRGGTLTKASYDLPLNLKP